MLEPRTHIAMLALVSVVSGCAGTFQDETTSLLPRPLVSLRSPDEKSIEIGDLDRDGRTDIVICNKKPYRHDEPDGKRAAILLMNERTGGQLQDRTASLTDWYLPDKHNDCRDVVIAELTGDDWLDVVFVNTSGQQPRLYRNRGRDERGRWAGFEDDSAARLPTLTPRHTYEGGRTTDVRVLFCSGAAGDIDGDGDSDLYFGNYNPENRGVSGDVLLINQGDRFADETATRLAERANSKFVTDVVLADMDRDGDLDLVKNNSQGSTYPFGRNSVGLILYNDGRGSFRSGAWKELPAAAPYMLAVGRIDGDASPDVYQVTDGIDYYVFGPDFERAVDVRPESTGRFGGNVHMADLDGDGDLDVGVADVDTNFANCPGDSSAPGQFTLLVNVGEESARTLEGQYLVDGARRGGADWRTSNVFDFAFVDVNGDGRLDIFMGLCQGYRVLLRDSGSMEP